MRQYKRKHGVSAPVELKWNPLIVDKDIALEGESVDAYARRKWGAANASKLLTALRRAGLPEGASFRDWRTVPNTLMAQQLMALAAELGLAGQAATALFSKTYEQGGNVGRLEELLDVGQGLGLPRGPLQGALLAGNAGTLREAVLERDAAAKQRLRITAVPHLIVTAGPACRTKYSLSGPQPPSELLGALERVAAEEARAVAVAASPYADLLAGVAGGMTGGAAAAAAGAAAIVKVPKPALVTA